jgi:hypothetical protein
MSGLIALATCSAMSGLAGTALARRAAQRRLRGLRTRLTTCQWALADARTDQAERQGLFRAVTEHASDVIVRLDA